MALHVSQPAAKPSCPLLRAQGRLFFVAPITVPRHSIFSMLAAVAGFTGSSSWSLFIVCDWQCRKVENMFVEYVIMYGYTHSVFIESLRCGRASASSMTENGVCT